MLGRIVQELEPELFASVQEWGGGAQRRAGQPAPENGWPLMPERSSQSRGMNGLANWPFCFLCIFIS